MAAMYSDMTKLRDAKQIARDHGCFIVEVAVRDNYGLRTGTRYLVYREATPKNQFVGGRKSVGTLLAFVKKATNFH